MVQYDNLKVKHKQSTSRLSYPTIEQSDRIKLKHMNPPRKEMYPYIYEDVFTKSGDFQHIYNHWRPDLINLIK